MARVKVLRLAAVAAIWCAAAAGIDRLTVRPLRCEARVKAAEVRMTQALQSGEDVAAVARRTQRGLAECLRARPAHLHTALVAGGAYRLGGQPQRAVEVYRQAARFHRRPELLVNAGLAHLAAGHRDAAVAALTEAAAFDPEALPAEGLAPDVASAVEGRLAATPARGGG